MTCPVCSGDTQIVDSRKDCDHVIRYRKCKDCGRRFPTIEVDEDFYRRRKETDIKSDKKFKKFMAEFKKITGKLSDLGEDL